MGMNTKTIIGFLVGLLLTSMAFAQQPYKPANAGWLVDVKEAQAISAKTNKPILANFTGSDWCGWCMRLTRDVFSKPEFKEWAKENVVLLELDFPRGKKLPQEIAQQNYGLKNAFQVQGFPTIWMFNLKKNEGADNFNILPLGKLSYTPSANAFIAKANSYMKK